MTDPLVNYFVQHPDAGLASAGLAFPGATSVQLRRAQRAAQLAATATPTAIATPVGQAALRAGFFRPVEISYRPVERRPRPLWRGGAGTGLILPDIHAPKHDPRALDVAIQIGLSLPLSWICLSGDQMDVGAQARYLPSKDRPYRWVEERREALKPLIEIRATWPDLPIHFLFGNHEDRVETFMASHAPQQQGLFTKADQLGITDLDFSFPEDNRLLLANDTLMVKHGSVVAGQAGATAIKEVQKAGISVIHGHVHRSSIVHVSRTAQSLDGGPPLVGVEAGCLCSLDPEYILSEDTPNWQQGCVVYTEFDDGTFIPEQVRIHDGYAYFRGRQFRSRV